MLVPISVSTLAPTTITIDGTFTIIANDFSTTATTYVTIASPGGIITANWNGVTRIVTPGITTITTDDDSAQVGTLNEDNNVGGIIITTSSEVTIRSHETIHITANDISAFVANGIVGLSPNRVVANTYDGASLVVVDL